MYFTQNISEFSKSQAYPNIILENLDLTYDHISNLISCDIPRCAEYYSCVF